MAAGDVSASILLLNAKPCAVFDGVDDYIDTALTSNSDFLNGFTISAWIIAKSPEVGNSQGKITSKDTGTAGQNGITYGYRADFDAVSLLINAGTERLSATNSVVENSGTWYHVLVTVNSGALVTHYINGTASGTAGGTGALSGITTTNALRIGNRAGATDRTFNGAISDIKIWNRVLTSEEITKDFNNQLVSKDLVHRWKLKDNSNDDVTGSSSTDSGVRFVIQDSDVTKRIKNSRISSGDVMFVEDALIGNVIYARLDNGS